METNEWAVSPEIQDDRSSTESECVVNIGAWNFEEAYLYQYVSIIDAVSTRMELLDLLGIFDTEYRRESSDFEERFSLAVLLYKKY